MTMTKRTTKAVRRRAAQIPKTTRNSKTRNRRAHPVSEQLLVPSSESEPSAAQTPEFEPLELQVVPQAVADAAHGVRVLAEFAGDDDDALRGLADIATEATVTLQSLWLHGRRDKLASQSLDKDELGPRETFHRGEMRKRLVDVASARLIWPAILTPRPIDAKRAQQWLTSELQLGKTAAIKPPRREASEHQEGFRLLAVEVIWEAKALCQESLAQKGEGDLGERLRIGRKLVSLSNEPSKKWLGTLEKNWKLLLGEDWLNRRPQLRLFRRAYRQVGGIPVPAHQKKAAPGALKRKLPENSHARMLQRHANQELRRAVAGLLPTA
jgi:hypothetical protein